MAETARDEIIQLAGSIRALEPQLEVALAMRRVELNDAVRDGIAQFRARLNCKASHAHRRDSSVSETSFGASG